MQIDCPSCAASYEVAESLLVGRKMLRCARCGAEWVPAAAPLPPPPAPPAEPARPPLAGATPPQARRPAPAPAPPRRSRGLGLAWAVSVLVLAGGIGAAFVWQDRIVQIWPPSLRLYVALGLAHNPG